MSEHNERIKHVYGNYCFWAWFRYWYIDSVNYVTMLLLDKGYYDYDYENAPKPPKNGEDVIKSDEEVRNILAGFGLKQFAENKPETDAEIQDYILKQMEEK